MQAKSRSVTAKIGTNPKLETSKRRNLPEAG